MSSHQLSSFENESVVGFLAHVKKNIEFKTRKQKITLSELAKKGGFKSRSYVGMVLDGKKRITDQAIPSFIKMFDLKKDEEKYFISLIEVERELPGSKEKLKKLQKRLTKKDKRDKIEVQSEELITPTTFHVYASLGSQGNARSLEKIVSYTGLSHEICLRELNTLISKKWAICNSGEYVLSDDRHLIVDPNKRSDFNKNWFMEESKKAQTIAEKDFENKDHLFLTYKFSIHQDNMPRLRESLKEVLSTWAENCTQDDSNRVVSLNLSLI